MRNKKLALKMLELVADGKIYTGAGSPNGPTTLVVDGTPEDTVDYFLKEDEYQELSEYLQEYGSRKVWQHKILLSEFGCFSEDGYYYVEAPYQKKSLFGGMKKRYRCYWLLTLTWKGYELLEELREEGG